MSNKAEKVETNEPNFDSEGQKEPIAIIGIGCRFPGGADDPERFWQLLVNEVDAITDIPADRVDVAPYYDPMIAAPGKIASNQGGFLHKVDEFDASFFGVSPREANYMDPQQRLLLETAWEALEDAGQVPAQLKASQTGVFIGMWANDYTEKMYKSTEDINLYITTGGGRYAASGRLSYFFGFQGPSLTVDTACSSSLVSVHLACQSLREGESTLALAGGVNIILEPSISIGYSRSKMLSPDGHCKFGDIKANGYVRSEGVGLVVLKRLSQALADNDLIYAVIRGSAVNNDGRSSELLVAPGIDSQIKLLHDAYRNAGVAPAKIGYLEAHGTGTPVGDPVEMEALGTVLSEGRDAARACRIGSIKTNIGHTEAASGVAGLIKAALCIQHKAIPASLHFTEPNPKIPWAALLLEMQTKLTPWPDGMKPALAGVNSFGITGTNAHVVLAEAPPSSQRKPVENATRAYLLPVSAQTPKALQGYVESYLDFLKKDDVPALQDLCYTASCRRTHHAARLAFVAGSHQELTDQLSSYLQETQAASQQNPIDEHAKIVFVFPGQGAQWLGMGRELVKQNQVFRDTLMACEQAMRPWVDWSLMEQLDLSDDSPAYRLNEISVIQPVLFAIEVSLAALWQSWGVEPAAVIGHSMGEIAAAYIAGALTLQDAAHVICSRSQLMQRTSGHGAMAVIGLPFQEVETLIKGVEDKLSLAVENSPRSSVLSGDPNVLETVLEGLREKEIFCRLIKVDVASHSPQMDPIRLQLIEALNGIQPRAASIPMYSTVTQNLCDGESLDAEYWGRNLREPVRFAGTVQRLLDDEHAIFIEISPHPVLLSSIEETVKAAEKFAHAVSSTRREQPELRTLLGEVGSLYALGYEIDWSKLYPHSGEVVSLPAYPWQRERYWFEASTLPAKQSRPGAHPLLGQYLNSANGIHVWETAVSTKLFPYLNDHQVRGSAVFPAAGYVEMVLAAASEVFGPGLHGIHNISFQEAFFLPADAHQMMQLVMTGSTDEAEFQFYSSSGQNNSDKTWTLHASGRLRINQHVTVQPHISLKALRDGQQAETTAAEFYESTASRGLNYGPGFQAITLLARQDGGILAKIKLPGELVSQAGRYRLHPVLIDACFQAVLAGLPETNEDTYLPTHLGDLQDHCLPSFDSELWGYVVATSDHNSITADILLFNGDGQIVMSVRGLQMQRLEAGNEDVRDFLYEIEWQESPIPHHDHPESKHWLIFSDHQGVGQALAEYLLHDSQTCTLVFAGSDSQATNTNSYQVDPAQPGHIQQLLKEVAQPVHHIVHLWSLDNDPVPSLADSNLQNILYLTQAIAQHDAADSPRLWLVTRGTQTVHDQPEPVSVSQSSVWGMGAVIANELPNLHCTRVDLGSHVSDGENEILMRTLLANDGEDQVALRNRQRYVARLKRIRSSAESDATSVIQQKIDVHQSFQVQITTPGILDGLMLKPMLRTSPGAGEVEITVKATGLNFMNVMGAMGIYPGYPNGVGPLGIECAGIISNIGAGVTGLHVGDEVAAIAFNSLASHAVTNARLVVKKPAFMSFEEAASIPIAYVTAYYALEHLGRLQKGERVLIHSATGGVGLAAIQLAKHVGAEIFTTAGSPEKREHLRDMGIKHVMDSRSLLFADEVMEATNGEGVDMLLNSLAGNAIPKGLEILKPYGRFLEIGKRDIYQNSKVGLLPFRNNLSYFAIDLDKMSRERPDILGRMLHDIFELLEARQVTVLPVQCFPVSQVGDAFRLMAQAKHMGKIAISLEDPAAHFKIPASATPINANATYLITGGLGDLGLAFAKWLARQGARHLVLMGRSKATDTAQKMITDLRDAGVNVVAVQADVTNFSQISEAFLQIRGTMPPVKGIIHAAGLLADGTILQMDWERFALAYAPKVLGAWNLDRLSVDQDLDFFILFSSVAAILGTPGQVNYAAGNAFLDAMARSRRAQNRPALSINWGPWSEIGLASSDRMRGERLMQQGLRSISPTQGLEAMQLVMTQGNPQVSVVSLNAKKWCAAQPAAARSSLFSGLLNQNGAEASVKKTPAKNIRDELLAAEPGRQRRSLLDMHLREHVGQVLHLPASRVPLDKPLKTLGLDSLMSIELRNRLEDALGVSLSATLIWNYPTVAAMAPFLAEKMGIVLESEQGPPSVERAAQVQSMEQELDDLSRDEIEALLDEELSAIDDSLKESGFDTETGSG